MGHAHLKLHGTPTQTAMASAMPAKANQLARSLPDTSQTAVTTAKTPQLAIMMTPAMAPVSMPQTGIWIQTEMDWEQDSVNSAAHNL